MTIASSRGSDDALEGVKRRREPRLAKIGRNACSLEYEVGSDMDWLSWHAWHGSSRVHWPSSSRSSENIVSPFRFWTVSKPVREKTWLTGPKLLNITHQIGSVSKLFTQTNRFQVLERRKHGDGGQKREAFGRFSYANLLPFYFLQGRKVSPHLHKPPTYCDMLEKYTTLIISASNVGRLN